MSLARVHNFAISLDGFGTGEGQSADAHFGHAGERLHERMFATRWWQPGVHWDGLEGLEKDYQVEATSSPSGVTHVTFTRAGI